MTHAWIETSDRLPHDGDAVEFVVDRSGVLLQGVYERCVFKASWSYHAVVDVRRWRRLDRVAEHWSSGLHGPLARHDAADDPAAPGAPEDSPRPRRRIDGDTTEDVRDAGPVARAAAIGAASADAQPLPRPGLRRGLF